MYNINIQLIYKIFLFYGDFSLKNIKIQNAILLNGGIYNKKIIMINKIK